MNSVQTLADHIPMGAQRMGVAVEQDEAGECPAWVRLVEKLPRTATGKLQRYKLRASIDAKV